MTGLVRLATALFVLAIVFFLVPVSRAQDDNQAAIVVRFDDGRTEAHCVGFEEAEISGLELIDRAGLEMDARFEGQGALVCGIDGVGCPSDDCFCQCGGGADCVYWSYWHQQENEWRYARSSATAFQVQDGMVEGWSWGPGTVSEAIEPSLMTFSDICTDETGLPSESNRVESEAGASGSLLAFGVVLALIGVASVILRARRNQS